MVCKLILYAKISLTMLILEFYSSLSFAQAPDILWTRTYGDRSEDKSFSVQQTHDEGYIIAGYKTSMVGGLYDVYLIKTDENGDTLWTKTFGGDRDDMGFSVQQTSDCGYIVVGSTKSFGPCFCSVYLLKTNEDGDTLWTKTYGWTNANNTGYSVQQTTDGGYIIAGSTVNHMLLIKTDGNGDAQWIREYGTTTISGGFSVQQTSDSGYIVGGFYSFGSYDFYIVKTDSIGDTLWTRLCGEPEYDRCYSVQETADGGYIVAGGINMLYRRYGADVWLIKMDADGNVVWLHELGGSNDDVGYSVQQTSDGGYIITGRTYSFGAGDWDVYFIKTDEQGDALWTNTCGGVGAEWGHSVKETSDGGYVIAGWTNSFGLGDCDVYLIKTAPDTFGVEEHTPAQPAAPGIHISPNPFRHHTNIRYEITDNCGIDLKIYNISGRLVNNFSALSSDIGHQSSIKWDGRDYSGKKLPSGVYFLKFAAGDYRETRKLLLVK